MTTSVSPPDRHHLNGAHQSDCNGRSASSRSHRRPEQCRNCYNVNLGLIFRRFVCIWHSGKIFLVHLESRRAQAETPANITATPPHHRQPEGSGHRAGPGNPLPAVGLERRDDHSVQEGRVSLKVPSDHPGNRIILDLDVRDDAVGTIVVASGGGTYPRSTPVRSHRGAGQPRPDRGARRHPFTTEREDDTKVPDLGDIPASGTSSRTRCTRTTRTSSMIFITPKIVREGP